MMTIVFFPLNHQRFSSKVERGLSETSYNSISRSCLSSVFACTCSKRFQIQVQRCNVLSEILCFFQAILIILSLTDQR